MDSTGADITQSACLHNWSAVGHSSAPYWEVCFVLWLLAMWRGFNFWGRGDGAKRETYSNSFLSPLHCSPNLSVILMSSLKMYARRTFYHKYQEKGRIWKKDNLKDIPEIIVYYLFQHKTCMVYYHRHTRSQLALYYLHMSERTHVPIRPCIEYTWEVPEEHRSLFRVPGTHKDTEGLYLGHTIVIWLR